MYKLILLAAVLSALTAVSYTAPGFMEEAEEEADSKDESLMDFIKKTGNALCKYVPVVDEVCKAKKGAGGVSVQELQELLGNMMDDDVDDIEMDAAEMEDFTELCPYVPIADKICKMIGYMPSL